jgi:rhodanese-related sulfurtransferase
LSPSSARVAEQLGYTSVKVFHAGMPAWKQKGGLVLSHPEDLDKMIHKEAYILIDLRDKAIAERGHLPGAISIPAAQLAGSRSLFPEDKSVLIILYTASGHDEKSFEIVKSWGYKNVSVLDGGVAAWRESQGKLFSGLLWTPSL